jgi:hypothetical protein
LLEIQKAPTVWGPVINGCVGQNIWPMWGLTTTDNYYSPSELLPLIEIVSQNVNPNEEGLYTITYRVTDPSGNTSNIFTRMVEYTYWPKCINSTVGIENVKANESVNIYPNPNTGLFNIDLNGALTQNALVEVFNTMGQKVFSQVYTEAAGKFEIDLREKC